MSYLTKPTYIFREKTSVGVAEVPINSFIIVNDWDGKVKQLFKNNAAASISNTNTVEECLALGAIIEVSAADSANYLSKTGSYTLEAGDFVYADTTGGPFTLTLALNPLNNDRVIIMDTAGNFEINAVTLDRNNRTIMGLEEDMEININNLKLELVYINNDWRIM